MAGIGKCEAEQDYVSREILARILKDTESHIDWLKTQQNLLQNLGEANYLQSAAGELSQRPA